MLLLSTVPIITINSYKTSEVLRYDSFKIWHLGSPINKSASSEVVYPFIAFNITIKAIKYAKVDHRYRDKYGSFDREYNYLQKENSSHS